MNPENQNSIGFSQLISERFPQFTKSERLIANYLNQNQDEAAFLSAGEIAGRLVLSEATMVRFARPSVLTAIRPCVWRYRKTSATA